MKFVFVKSIVNEIECISAVNYVRYYIDSAFGMSFRDTFTRSSSSENLRYDDAAAYHFYITILIIVVVPLGWSVLKTITNPFSHIPTLSELEKKKQFRDKIARFKK